MAIVVSAALFLVDTLGALTLGHVGDKVPTSPWVHSDPSYYASPWATYDGNKDGKVDYLILYDKLGNKAQEIYDTNYDGILDDFTEFDGGVPVLRMMDSNGDGKIDVWLFISQGTYIVGLERDTNGDGILDEVRDYTKKAEH